MEGTTFKSLVLGFIAGALATVTAHEIVKFLLFAYAGFPIAPWNLDPVTTGPMAAYNIPQLASDAFWGGLWGIVFALLWGSVPKGPLTFKGALLGMLGPALIGVFILVPLLTGKFPPFFGGDPKMILSVLAITAGFGASTGWLYGFLTSGCRLP